MKRFAIILSLIALALSTMAVWMDSDPINPHIGVGAGLDGQFSIGVPPSPPEFPEVRELLHSSYRHESPEGAYFSLWIDSSTIYSNGPIIPIMYPDSAVYIDDYMISPTHYDPINSWLKTEWFFVGDPYGNDSIRVSQILQPVETGGSGTAIMKWIIHNESSRPHDIGMMLFFDTKISLSDTARIVAPGIPISDSVRILPDPVRGWDIPPYWEAYEGDPSDTSDHSLVAKAVISLPPNTSPDRLAFGDIHDFLGAYWEPEITMLEYFDSAVLSWWNPVTVEAGATIIIQTSYGLADSTASVGGIYGMRVAYPHFLLVRGCALSPDPFSMTVGVTNNSDSTVSDLHVTVDLSSAVHCSLATDEVADKPTSPRNLAEGETGFAFWSMKVNRPPLDEIIDTVFFRAYTTDSFTVSPPFLVNIKGSDYIGPEANTVEPLWATITSDPNQVIKMYIHDAHSSVDSTRIFFGFINSDGLYYVGIDSPELSFMNDTLYFNPPSPLMDGSYYWFFLDQAEDIHGCPSESDSGRFLCDLNGPVLGPNHFPPDSTIQTDSLLRVWINAEDMLGSIRLQTINWRFILDGFITPVNVWGGIAGDGVGVATSSDLMRPDTVYWNSRNWTSGLSHIPDGWVTNILADLTDDPDYGIPNRCPDVPFGWTWIMNSHGPRAKPVIPDDGDYVSVPDTDITYYLYDGNSMIPDSSRIMLDGGVITTHGGPRDSLHTIIVDPSTGFPHGYRVNIEVVNAYDSLFTPLDMSSHRSWHYNIDTRPPVIVNGSIGHGDTIGVDHLEVSIAIADSNSGVNPESLTITVNDIPVSTSWAAGLATFTLDVSTDTASIRVRVCDLIDVGPQNWLDQTMTIYIVMQGPRARFIGNADGFICSPSGPILWLVNDPDGVVESSIKVVVNGDTLTTDNPELTYTPSTGVLSYSPATPWTDGTYITAQLISAEDIYGFTLATPIDGSWIVDLDMPAWRHTVEGLLFDPGTGYFDDSLIVIHWTWGDGELDSVSLSVGGNTFTEGSAGFIIEDTMLIFDSPAADFVLDSAVTYYFVIQAKTLCAFSEGEWVIDSFMVFSTEVEEAKLPFSVELMPNRPDPFNATTTIPFQLVTNDKVKIEITDMLGRHVREVYSGILSAGLHEKVWDGRDDRGRDLPSGVYNCRLSVGREIHSQRITLIR